MMSEPELKRVVTLLEQARALAVGREEPAIVELIERARRAALEQMYPGAAPFISLRKRPVKSKIA
jgi:hypothetical protein